MLLIGYISESAAQDLEVETKYRLRGHVRNIGSMSSRVVPHVQATVSHLVDFLDVADDQNLLEARPKGNQAIQHTLPALRIKTAEYFVQYQERHWVTLPLLY